MVCLLTGAATASAQEILTVKPGSEKAPPPPSERTWTDVRVITADNWHLDGVTVAWLDDGTMVRVTFADGTSKDYRPEEIVSITAADGTDLTGEVAEARPATLGSWADHGLDPSRAAAAPVPLDCPIRFAFTAGGAYGFFTGGWYLGFDPSFGAQATARVGSAGRGWFTLAFRRQGGGSEVLTVPDGTGNSVRTSVDAHIDEYLVMYGLPTRKVSPREKVPYVEFGFAFLKHVSEADLPGGGLFTASATKTGLVLQLGGLVGLGKGWVADAGASVIYKPSEGESGAAGTIYAGYVSLGYALW